MTSMAAKGNIRLYFAADFHKAEKKNNAIMAMQKRSGSNPQRVNVKKVNGINVADRNEITHRTLSAIDDHQLPLHSCLLGKFVDEKLVYRQTFVIRSYEIGPDKTATMETLMNLLQETALNHVTGSGLAGNGFGSTREMILRKLIWVVTRIHVQVQKYSSWGDVVEIDTWVDAAGKNGMRRDWIIRDYNTKDIITRATSTWVIMNRETRKLSKIPQQVRQEVVPFYTNKTAIAEQNNHVHKIDKLTDETAQTIKSGLAPRWSDMDANQHVNNVKYIGYILESVPMKVLGEYNMTSMTLEYRRECQQSNLLESLTSTTQHSQITNCGKPELESELEYTHLLRMQTDKTEIIRARTQWQPKLIH